MTQPFFVRWVGQCLWDNQAPPPPQDKKYWLSQQKKLVNDKGEEIYNAGSHQKEMLSNIKLQLGFLCSHN
jgi:hypothetical protein